MPRSLNMSLNCRGIHTIYSEWGNEIFLSCNTSQSRGVAILFGNLDYEIHQSLLDSDGNYVLLDLTIDDHRFTLASIYGPNQDNPQFYTNLFEKLDYIGNDSFMICGDFNLVLNPELDYHNYKHINNKNARNYIREIIEERQLIDPFRKLNPETRLYTWRKVNPIQQARLDFFLVSTELSSNIVKSSIEHSYLSDHSIISTTYIFNEFEYISGLWKHNNSLLQDIEYIHTINKKNR